MIHLFAHTITPEVTLTKEDAFHLFSVLRLKAHEPFQLVYEGQAYLAEVPNLNTQKIVILKSIALTTEPSFSRHLYLPLLKGEKLEWVLQKATELGVSSIQLYSSRFTVVDWDNQQWAKKENRLKKIIHEAAMQSQRLLVPTLLAPEPLSSITSRIRDGMKCVALETLRQQALTLKSHIQTSSSVHLLVGPEGGFDTLEIEEMIHHHWLPFSLGPRILRSETAVIAALAILEETLSNILKQ